MRRLGTAGGSGSGWHPVPQRAWIIGGAVFLSDQLTKAAANAVTPGRFIRPARNARFSLGLAGGPLVAMVAVTVAVIIGFGWLVVRQACDGRLPWWVPSLLVGGAASNLFDRLAYGAVRDFVATGVVWNLADVAVLVALVVFVWGQLFTAGEVIPR